MRAVVALARECKLDNLEIKFRDNFDAQSAAKNFAAPDLVGIWREGRHGAPSTIAINFVCQYGIAEK